MKLSKKIIVYCVIVVLTALISGPVYKQLSGKNNVHYKDNNYCFVHVQIRSGRTLEDYSGTMSVNDYHKWTNGEEGTVFVYTDKKAKYGVRLNVASITSISNYGDTPYAYD